MSRYSKAEWKNTAEARLVQLKNLQEVDRNNSNKISELSGAIDYLAKRLDIRKNYLNDYGYMSTAGINRLVNDIKLQEAQVRAEEAAERLGLIGKETKDV